MADQKIRKYLIKQNHFCLTYGDGVSDVNLKKVLKLHLSKNKIATVTAVRPPSNLVH